MTFHSDRQRKYVMGYALSSKVGIKKPRRRSFGLTTERVYDIIKKGRYPPLTDREIKTLMVLRGFKLKNKKEEQEIKRIVDTLSRLQHEAMMEDRFDTVAKERYNYLVQECGKNNIIILEHFPRIPIR